MGGIAWGKYFSLLCFAFVEIVCAWIVVYLVILSPLDTWIKSVIGFAAFILSIGLIVQAFKKN